MRTMLLSTIAFGVLTSAALAGSAEPVRLADEQMDRVTAGTGGGAGKVSMQDFHFVMRQSVVGTTSHGTGAGAGKVNMN